MGNTITILTLAGLLLAGAVQADEPEGFGALKNQVVEQTLSNGLRVLILPRREVPVLSVATVASVGSVDETVGITGIAHMFEHMAFKGSSRIGTKDFQAEKAAMAEVDAAFAALKRARHAGAPAEEVQALEEEFSAAQKKARSFVEPNEYSSILERNGAVGLNASTGMDSTNYFYSLPSNKLELWMSLESERFLDPVLREFYVERDVVLEERNMRVDSSPLGRLLEEFLALSFSIHPYGRMGIGVPSDLLSFTRQEAEVFYSKHYGAKNLIVAIVGDVEPEKTLEMAETYFGRLPAGPDPEPVETIEPKQNSTRRSTLYGQAQRIALMGFHKPSGTHPDEPIYQTLSSILSDGRTSRMYRSLVEEKKLATYAGGLSGFPGSRYPNLFVFFAFPAPGQTNEAVLEAMEEEIQKLKNQVVEESELARVKAKAKAQLIQQLGSNQGMALQLAQQEALSGWEDLFDSLDKIAAVTPDDIQRIAKETFHPGNRTIVLLEPEATSETEEKVQ